MIPTETIPEFDEFLEARGLRFESVIIGSSALALLGIAVRATDDCDVLDPSIPEAIRLAAQEFGIARGIDPDWFNHKSNDFVGVPGCLPDGWRSRLQLAFEGRALRLQTLGRLDLICTKLVALVDRGVDFADCVAMRPSAEEMRNAWPFVAAYEGNEESRIVYWIPVARKQLTRLARELDLDVVF